MPFRVGKSRRAERHLSSRDGYAVVRPFRARQCLVKKLFLDSSYRYARHVNDAMLR